MTTRIGVIADIHADLGAVEAALAQLDAEGIELVVCCGDVVDGGDQPEKVIALLRERAIPTVAGNHDRWGLERHDAGDPEHEGDEQKLFLSPDTISWLAGLPPIWRATIEGARIAVVHGTPLSDSDSFWPTDSDEEVGQWLAVAQADVLVAGHSHAPMERRLPGGRLVANPGALWRGAGGLDGSVFGVLELPSLAWQVRRVDL